MIGSVIIPHSKAHKIVSHLKRDFMTLKEQEVLERTKSPTSLTLFNNTVKVALFNYSKPHVLAYMFTSLTTVTVLKQWVKLLVC
jgi:hypothetical protein